MDEGGGSGTTLGDCTPTPMLLRSPGARLSAFNMGMGMAEVLGRGRGWVSGVGVRVGSGYSGNSTRPTQFYDTTHESRLFSGYLMS